jgi:hypothetical protein
VSIDAPPAAIVDAILRAIGYPTESAADPIDPGSTTGRDR